MISTKDIIENSDGAPARVLTDTGRLSVKEDLFGGSYSKVESLREKLLSMPILFGGPGTTTCMIEARMDSTAEFFFWPRYEVTWCQAFDWNIGPSRAFRLRVGRLHHTPTRYEQRKIHYRIRVTILSMDNPPGVLAQEELTLDQFDRLETFEPTVAMKPGERLDFRVDIGCSVRGWSVFLPWLKWIAPQSGGASKMLQVTRTG